MPQFEISGLFFFFFKSCSKNTSGLKPCLQKEYRYFIESKNEKTVTQLG